MSYDQTCHTCGGTFEAKASLRDPQTGEMSDWTATSCPDAADTADDAWRRLIYMMTQLGPRCPKDGPFDFRTGELAAHCDGCDYERAELLSLAWHYAQAVAKESREEAPA